MPTPDSPPVPSPIPPARAMIGRWPFDRYVDVLGRWVIVGGILVLGAVLTNLPQMVLAGIEVAIFAWLGWIVGRREGRPAEGLAAGAMSGLLLGALAAIGRFVLHPQFVWVLNVISESLVTALIGALLTAVTILLRQLFNR